MLIRYTPRYDNKSQIHLWSPPFFSSWCCLYCSKGFPLIFQGCMLTSIFAIVCTIAIDTKSVLSTFDSQIIWLHHERRWGKHCPSGYSQFWAFERRTGKSLSKFFQEMEIISMSNSRLPQPSNSCRILVFHPGPSLKRKLSCTKKDWHGQRYWPHLKLLGQQTQIM